MTATKRIPLWRRLLDGWMMIAGRFGQVQTLVILGLSYAFVIGPFASGIAIARRDLLAKRGLGAPGSAWRDAESVKADYERSRHPF